MDHQLDTVREKLQPVEKIREIEIQEPTQSLFRLIWFVVLAIIILILLIVVVILTILLILGTEKNTVDTTKYETDGKCFSCSRLERGYGRERHHLLELFERRDQKGEELCCFKSLDDVPEILHTVGLLETQYIYFL